MIKGVNRQIIEMRETDSKYFERALFFVNPDYVENEAELKAEADRLLALYGCGKPVATRENKKSETHRKAFAICFGIGTVVGAALCFLIRTLL